MFKCFIFLGFIWKLRIQHSNEIFYMTEFCWVTCHTYMIFLSFAFLSACGVEWEWLKKVTYNKTAIYAFWGLANGPFAFAVIGLRNALVLHDLPNLASAFIHLTPVSLSWTLRWFANDVMKKFPGVFNLPNPDLAINESLWDIFAPAMAFYFMWWVPYTFVYMLLFGRFQCSPWSYYDNVSMSTIKA